MQTQPQISFRNVERTPSVDRMIHKGIGRLDSVHERITGLRIAVEDQRGKGTRDHLYRVRIDVTVPGGEVVVREAPSGKSHPELDEIVGRAFDSARRRLRETRKQRRLRRKVAGRVLPTSE